MLPLYLARIEDLRRGDFVKVACAACHHVALLTRNSFWGLGSARAPRCSTSSGASGVADAGLGDGPSCRSSGGARAGELGLPLAPAIATLLLRHSSLRKSQHRHSLDLELP
jgi:hypothetical protein